MPMSGKPDIGANSGHRNMMGEGTAAVSAVH
jgi:hypothetical protein